MGKASRRKRERRTGRKHGLPTGKDSLPQKPVFIYHAAPLGAGRSISSRGLRRPGEEHFVKEEKMPAHWRDNPQFRKVLESRRILSHLLEEVRPSSLPVSRRNAIFFHALPPRGRKAVANIHSIFRMRADPKKTLVFDDGIISEALAALEKGVHAGLSEAELRSSLRPIAEEYWNKHVTLEEFMKYYERGLFEHSILVPGRVDFFFYKKKSDSPAHLPEYFFEGEILVNRDIPGHELKPYD